MVKTRKKSLSYKYCKRYTCRMVEILLPFLAKRPNTSEQTWSATRQMRHQEISGLSHCPLTADRVLWPSSVLTARVRDRFQKLSSHPARLLVNCYMMLYARFTHSDLLLIMHPQHELSQRSFSIALSWHLNFVTMG